MPRPPSLIPREYGAYAELLFPVATGLAAGRPGIAAWGLAGSALTWFLLYEPVAVLTGKRGERLRQAVGSRARRRIPALVVAGTVLGALAVVLSPPPARLAVLVPVGLALLLVPIVLAGRQKTLGAELLVVAALASVLLPVAAAAGVDRRFAWMALGVWLVSFALITLVVHAIKRRRGWTVWVAPTLAGLTAAAGAGLAATEAVPVAVGLALLPAALFVLVVALLRVHPRKLRVVGWSVVGANILTLILLLLA